LVEFIAQHQANKLSATAVMLHAVKETTNTQGEGDERTREKVERGLKGDYQA